MHIIPLTATRREICQAIDTWFAEGMPGLADGAPTLCVECDTTVGAVRPGQTVLMADRCLVMRGHTANVRVDDERLPGDDGCVTVIHVADGWEASEPADMPCRVIED